jgi:hypothetical protein
MLRELSESLKLIVFWDVMLKVLVFPVDRGCRFFVALAVIYHSSQCHIPEDSYLHSHSSENLVGYLSVHSLDIRGKRHNIFLTLQI